MVQSGHEQGVRLNNAGMRYDFVPEVRLARFRGRVEQFQRKLRTVFVQK